MKREELKFQYAPLEYQSLLQKIENGRLINYLRRRLHYLIRKRLNIEVMNRRNLPGHDNFVIAANHSSHLDIIALLSAMPLGKLNDCYSVAAADYFFANDLLAWLSKLLANTLPISRSYGAYSAIKVCGTLLDNGKNLIIFPEGTRSKDGNIHEFKSGIGILMAGRKQPVIPVYIKGAYDALPKGRIIPLKKKIEVIIGEPLYFTDRPDDSESWQQISRECEDAVKRLIP
ncbi:MAG: lysophospholipid acyltransferase family protein [Candidatus Margulisiibacteriota bacterium]